MKQFILITGGGLLNKGAQAMSFIAISEMRKRFEGLSPVLFDSAGTGPDLLDRVRGSEGADLDSYAFQIAWGNNPVARDSQLGAPVGISTATRLKRTAKGLLRAKDIHMLEYLYRNAAFCLDVSGYAFASKWGFESSVDYLRGIQLAQKYEVPLYLLPQSFGPLKFDDETEEHRIAELASRVFSYPEIVFAREASGVTCVVDLCPEATVRKSADLVLQSKGICVGSILRNVDSVPCRPGITTTRNVGIVPNARNAQFGDPDVVDLFYQKVVEKLLSEGYDVYLVRHAAEDAKACHRIKSLFEDEERVRLLGENRYCFEYDDLFAACDFLIASRYHSIVHSYKCGTPCISLGWADKYKELLDEFGQGDFAFDIVTSGFKVDKVLVAVDTMMQNHAAYRDRILSHLAEVQKESVFDQIEKDCLSKGIVR